MQIDGQHTLEQSTHVGNLVYDFGGSNPPRSYLLQKLWNDLQNTLEVRGVEEVLGMSLPLVPDGARLFWSLDFFKKSSQQRSRDHKKDKYISMQLV